MKKIINLTLAAAVFATSAMADTSSSAKKGTSSKIIMTATGDKPREHILLGRPSAKQSRKGALQAEIDPNALKADLQISPYFNGNSQLPKTGICGAWNGGSQKVKYRIKNTGTKTSEATSTTIMFKKTNGWDGVVVNLPTLNPGQSWVVQANVPEWAWTGGDHQHFQALAHADASQFVTETNEFNNILDETCIGPAG
ncbi:MAG: CARDB domain-containing protein [Pseudomonadota bacterium]